MESHETWLEGKFKWVNPMPHADTIRIDEEEDIDFTVRVKTYIGSRFWTKGTKLTLFCHTECSIYSRFHASDEPRDDKTVEFRLTDRFS